MAEYEGGIDEGALKQLKQGRAMLWISIAGSVLLLATLSRSSTAPAIVGMIASFLGAVGGIGKVAHATGGNVVVRLLAVAWGFAPVLNIVPVAYYLWRAHSWGKAQDEAPPAAAVPPRRGAAPMAPPVEPAIAAPRGTPRAATVACAQPATAAPRKPVLSSAIACVKIAGFENVPEGERLEVRMESLPGAAASDEPLVRATHGVFGVFYLLDQGGHYAYANAGQLEASGASLEALHRVAVANLTRMANAKPGVQLVPQPGFHGLVLDGQLEASLVLVDALWDGTLREYVPNGAVVAVPARDICAFCDAGSEQGIAQLRQVVERVSRGGDHLLTDKLFLRKDRRWSLFAPAKAADLAPLEFKL